MYKKKEMHSKGSKLANIAGKEACCSDVKTINATEGKDYAKRSFGAMKK